MGLDALVEHFFKTRNVVGQTVTRTLQFDLQGKGYTGPQTEPYNITEVTMPVVKGKHEYVLRSARHDVPTSPEDEGKPRYTAIYIGGGTSDAVSNVDQLARVEDAIQGVKDKLPFHVTRYVALPHITGAPRTKGPDDAAMKPTMAESADVLMDAVHSKELNISEEGVILTGYSAGATQILELAAKLGDRCKYVILADPAGMAVIDPKKLGYEFSVGAFVSGMKKYKDLGFSEALAKTLWETRVTWGKVGSSVPTYREMLRDMVLPPWRMKLLGEAYGLGSDMAPIAVNMLPITADSTKAARDAITANIVFSPVLGAGLANTVVARLKEKYESPDALMQADPQALKADVTGMLKELFPHAHSLQFSGFRDITHSAPRYEPDYWNNILRDIAEKASSSRHASTEP